MKLFAGPRQPQKQEREIELRLQEEGGVVYVAMYENGSHTVSPFIAEFRVCGEKIRRAFMGTANPDLVEPLP